ncbi:MAG: hypothetical protein HRU19_22060 [Pseudobacteriovorax sp.]|nr:hypothetical protein [Pseudobacteriovorax sp.]
MRRPDDGFSLISTLVAMGVAGILAIFIVRMTSNNVNATAKVTHTSERGLLRNMIWEAKSCDRVMPCQPNQAVQLERERPNGSVTVLVANQPPLTRFGRHTVRATCNSQGDGIIVESLILNDNSGGYRDPLTKKSLPLAALEHSLRPKEWSCVLAPTAGQASSPALTTVGALTPLL